VNCKSRVISDKLKTHGLVKKKEGEYKGEDNKEDRNSSRYYN